MRNSDAKFACEPRSELIFVCLATNAADRNFSNFVFNAVKYLAWLAMRNSHPKNGHNHASLYEPLSRPREKCIVVLVGVGKASESSCHSVKMSSYLVTSQSMSFS